MVCVTYIVSLNQDLKPEFYCCFHILICGQILAYTNNSLPGSETKGKEKKSEKPTCED